MHKVRAKEIALGCFALALGLVAFANLLCALIYGEIFIVRGSDWASLDDRPVKFVLSVLASLVVAPFCGFMGAMMLKSAKDDRRFVKDLGSAPRYEDPTKTSRHEG